MLKELGSAPFAVKQRQLRCVMDCDGDGVQPLINGVFDDDPLCCCVQHSFLFKMAPSICNKSVWIVGTLFRAKTTNFASGFEPNGAILWGNGLEFIVEEKNTFQRYIICLCLIMFVKKSYFRD